MYWTAPRLRQNIQTRLGHILISLENVEKLKGKKVYFLIGIIDILYFVRVTRCLTITYLILGNISKLSLP